MLLPHKLLNIVMIIVVVLAIQSCGFKPIYSKDSSLPVVDSLMGINVNKIAFGRAGQVLQTHLEDLLNPKGQSVENKYNLSVNLASINNPLAIEQDAEITRYNLILTAKIKLIDKETGEVVFNDAIRITSSYQTVASDFATYTVEEDTLLRSTKEMAESIRIHLSSYFMQHNEG